MTVPVRSDFLAYLNFPEVYHGVGISEATFFTPAVLVAGREVNTTYMIDRS